MCLRQEYAFCGFSFHIFAYLSPQIVKIKDEIEHFKPKCWNMKYKVFQKISENTQPNAVKI